MGSDKEEKKDPPPGAPTSPFDELCDSSTERKDEDEWKDDTWGDWDDRGYKRHREGDRDPWGGGWGWDGGSLQFTYEPCVARDKRYGL